MFQALGSVQVSDLQSYCHALNLGYLGYMGVSKIRGYLIWGVLFIRILLFRVLYEGPLFSATPMSAWRTFGLFTLEPFRQVSKLNMEVGVTVPSILLVFIISHLIVQATIWVVVNIRVPFGVPTILRHLVFRGPKKGP